MRGMEGEALNPLFFFFLPFFGGQANCRDEEGKMLKKKKKKFGQYNWEGVCSLRQGRWMEGLLFVGLVR
jgi:hypothetical protein